MAWVLLMMGQTRSLVVSLARSYERTRGDDKMHLVDRAVVMPLRRQVEQGVTDCPLTLRPLI